MCWLNNLDLRKNKIYLIVSTMFCVRIAQCFPLFKLTTHLTSVQCITKMIEIYISLADFDLRKKPKISSFFMGIMGRGNLPMNLQSPQCLLCWLWAQPVHAFLPPLLSDKVICTPGDICCQTVQCHSLLKPFSFLSAARQNVGKYT